MFKNYFKIAFRNLWRNKLYASINLLGLTLGITCSLIIFIFLKYETLFDAFHEDAEHIYRIVQHNKTAEGTNFWGTTAYTLATAINQEIPEIEATQTAGPFSRTISYENQRGQIARFEEKKILFVAPNYLEMLNFKGIHKNLWLEGNPQTAFDNPNAVVLSEKLIQKYFPEAVLKKKSILGKVLKLNNKDPLTITGVIKNLPLNTNLSFDILIPYAFFKKHNPYPTNNWSGNYQGTTYVKIPKNANSQDILAKITAVKSKHLDKDENERINYQLQHLSEIHTETIYRSSPGSYTMSSTILWGLAALALFLVLIAGFNFVNLSTALSIKRSKEIGIKKVIGSTRLQLMQQFMLEVLIITTMAYFTSLVFIELLLNSLNQYFKIVKLGLQFDGTTFIFGLGLVLLITLVAGFYPSFILSGYQPVKALKNIGISNSKNSLSIRKTLIIIQFGISYFLIFGTIVIARQMIFLQNKELGYNKEAIFKINIPNQEPNKLKRFKQELLNNPQIKNISYATGVPTSGEVRLGTTFRLDGEGLDMRKESEMKVVDLNYANMYGLKLITGSHLNKSHTTKQGFDSFVVNETLVKMLNLTPEEAIGKKLIINEGEATIVGVMQDFHNESLQEKISPCILMYWNAGFFWEAGIQLQNVQGNATQIREALTFTENTWKEIFPEWIPEYQFLDDHLLKNYLIESLVYDAFKVFAGIAIFLSSLGLFGLSAFTSGQRSKEIGIRKVLGASVANIFKLLSKDFIYMVIFAGLLAFPIAWYMMNQWLEGFVYRLEISWWIFALAILFCIGYFIRSSDCDIDDILSNV